MRIMIINTLYSPYKIGGAEVSVQLLAEGLVNLGNQVRVLTLHEYDIVKKNVINGVEVVYLPLKNKYWPYSDYSPTKFEKIIWHALDTYNPFMAKQVESEIKKFQPELVHTNNLAGFSVSVWPVIKKYNIPLVHTARDYYLFHPNSTLFKNGNIQDINSIEVKFWSLFKKIISRNVDCFVGISDFIKKLHLENSFFETENFTFIYNAVNKIDKKQSNNVKKTLGFIGRLTSDKGFDFFCDIAEENKEKYNFVAAGKFSNNVEAESLKNKALSANIKLLGFTQLEDFISLVDGVVLPIQWNEPFGRVVVECALAGINVYTNKKGGLVELFDIFENIFELDKSMGIKFNLHSVSEEIEREFYVINISKKYLNLYNEILLSVKSNG